VVTTAPQQPFARLFACCSGPLIDKGAIAAVEARNGSDHLVGNWGYCIACDSPTPGRLCETCATEPKHVEAAAALLTPTSVVALPDGREIEDGRAAVLRLPEHLSRRARQAAEAVARITTVRLRAGWSLSGALRTAALGRDQLGQELRQAGHPMDRKTVACLLEELTEAGVLARTGQLPAWTDPAEQDGSRVIKSGAYLYALTVELQTLGSRVLARVMASASLGGKRTAGRAEAALRWAVEHAHEGSRNRIGHWLACRCRDAGLMEGDADAILRRYVAGVEQGGHRYDLGEARRTLASVYRLATSGARGPAGGTRFA
jgi:hypothetical protein